MSSPSSPPERALRINIVQGAFLPVPTLRGGAVEKVWFALGQEFARRGHAVTHVSRRCDGLPAEEIIAGVQHRRVPGYDTPRSLLILKWRDLLYTRRVAAMLPAADVTVTNTFWAPWLLNSGRHGAIWVHVQRYPKGQMILYRRAARLQTVSSVIAKAILQQAPGLREKVCVIPNPLPPPAATSSPVTRDPNLVLFVGRVHPEKGLTLLVQAARLLMATRPATRLRIVGPWEARFGGGGEDFVRELKQLGISLGDRIEFTGPIFNEAELSSHFSSAAAFVYPSLADKGEASPVAPLEALARGLPVVVSDLECFADYLGDGPFAFRFDHRAASAPENLAVAIGDALKASGGEKLVNAARERAAEFSVERVADKYLHGFHEVIPNGIRDGGSTSRHGNFTSQPKSH